MIHAGSTPSSAPVLVVWARWRMWWTLDVAVAAWLRGFSTWSLPSLQRLRQQKGKRKKTPPPYLGVQTPQSLSKSDLPAYKRFSLAIQHTVTSLPGLPVLWPSLIRPRLAHQSLRYLLVTAHLASSPPELMIKSQHCIPLASCPVLLCSALRSRLRLVTPSSISQ
ncbi:hypothetical protein GGR52DRAFT_487218 [Hypoxylon sp. FL1284]|nr:hypothetical protein GGR52DRAFT_487218 [Hypoxylon sp. FL1284]